MTQLEPRRYRILSVLGEGAVGRVYHARLVRTDGFEKEVALKVLSERAPPRSVLERFRDEARILALVRDRAVVGVAPPVQLDGRWAVPMDFIDGATCRRVLDTTGALPPAAAAEIVSEIARALDQGWNQAGPDGGRLELIHRDVKPANIQVTPSGEVRLLDFGIAKARFAGREVRTRGHIGGTPGYIAPERLYGIEGPAADVYSLGIVLYELLVGALPDPDAVAQVGPLFDLVRGMLDIDPELRPPAREVERVCRAVLRELPGPSLREWAEVTVERAPPCDPDPLVGQVLEEDAAPTTAVVLEPAPSPWPWLLPLVAVLLLVAVVVGSTLGQGGSERPRVTERAPTPVPTPAPVAVAPTIASPPQVPMAVPPPAPPVRARVLRPPEPEGPRYPISVTSIPMGADVFLRAERVGVTPTELHLPAGRHEVRVELDGRSDIRTLHVGRQRPTRYVWRAEEGRWVSGY